jgi:hypothetical protein
LLELAPTVSRLYHDLLRIRFQKTLGMAPNAADTEAALRERTGKVVSLIQASYHAGLNVLVETQIECLLLFKAPANPFSADNFGGAMVAAVEAALPDAQQKDTFLEMLTPNFAIPMRSALRLYAKTFAREAQTIEPVPQQDRRRADGACCVFVNPVGDQSESASLGFAPQGQRMGFRLG